MCISKWIRDSFRATVLVIFRSGTAIQRHVVLMFLTRIMFYFGEVVNNSSIFQLVSCFLLRVCEKWTRPE